MNQVVFNRAMSYIDDDIVEKFFDIKRKARQELMGIDGATIIMFKFKTSCIKL